MGYTQAGLIKRSVTMELRQQSFLPQGHPLSTRYHGLLTKVASELGVSLATRSGVAKAADVIERRRFVVAEAAYTQIKWSASDAPTLIGKIRPIEQLFLMKATDELGPLVTKVFERQCSYEDDFDGTLSLLDKMAAGEDSLRHARRIRTSDIPDIRPAFAPTGISDTKSFASSVPWFPDKPTFNAMWPETMTEVDLKFLRAHLPKDHVIFKPYTVVESISFKDAKRLEESGFGKNSKGEQIEWVVRGEGNKRYLITNICFHPRFRNLFAEIASVLKANSMISVGGEELSGDFKAYLETVSDAIREGDFTKWLSADLNQAEGPLFFTFFPHEGYWADNIKFPFWMEAGIRDLNAMAEVRSNLSAIKTLEDIAVKVSERLGVPIRTKQFDPNDLKGAVEFVHLYSTFGFIPGLPNMVAAGHDYPKVEYPGVTKHRNVIIIDGTETVLEARRGILEIFLKPETIKLITKTAIQRFSLFHEVGHGILGNRPDTIMKNGKILGDVYGDLWGALAEPSSDLGSLVAARKLCEEGKISEEEKLGVYYNFFYRVLLFLLPKNVVLDPEILKENPHVAGQHMNFGYLLSQDGLVWLDSNNKLHFDVKKFEDAITSHHEKLIEFGISGTKESYLEYLTGCVNAIPDGLIDKVRGLVGKLSRVNLVRRAHEDDL